MISYWVNEGNADYPEVTFFGDSLAMINKHSWLDHVNSQGQQAGNDILFRYADLLLSLAEAYWRVDPVGYEGEITALLNRIRSRAGLPDEIGRAACRDRVVCWVRAVAVY